MSAFDDYFTRSLRLDVENWYFSCTFARSKYKTRDGIFKQAGNHSIASRSLICFIMWLWTFWTGVASSNSRLEHYWERLSFQTQRYGGVFLKTHRKKSIQPGDLCHWFWQTFIRQCRFFDYRERWPLCFANTHIGKRSLFYARHNTKVYGTDDKFCLTEN